MLGKEAIGQGKVILEPGTLWSRTQAQTQAALACGALHSINTDYEFVEQDNIPFLVRILTNLIRKDEATQKQGTDRNPFLPYDPDLFVADISETHLCLLNKFNVVDHHLLIVTRAFEEQECLLNLQDFEALWACMAEIDGLAFYNGGKIAGASQRHKHLQLVPFPIAPQEVKIPIEPAIATVQFDKGIGTVPMFPFQHAIASLPIDVTTEPGEAASVLLDCYCELLSAVGLQPQPETHPQQPGAYNLLATRKWMLIVPRSQEDFEGISVNSLGFAGTLLVRSAEQMQRLKSCRPLTVLQQVGIPIN